MDEIDRAQEHAEEILKRAILLAASRTRQLTPKGRCYNCEERIPKGRLFCDLDCSHDYDRRNK